MNHLPRILNYGPQPTWWRSLPLQFVAVGLILLASTYLAYCYGPRIVSEWSRRQLLSMANQSRQFSDINPRCIENIQAKFSDLKHFQFAGVFRETPFTGNETWLVFARSSVTPSEVAGSEPLVSIETYHVVIEWPMWEQYKVCFAGYNLAAMGGSPIETSVQLTTFEKTNAGYKIDALVNNDAVSLYMRTDGGSGNFEYILPEHMKP